MSNNYYQNQNTNYPPQQQQPQRGHQPQNSHPRQPPPHHHQQQHQRGSHGHGQQGQRYPNHGQGQNQGQGGPPQQQQYNQQQQQQLPPLRQPQAPTLNLNRDFTSAEELLKTLQQFNQSYDIFNNVQIPYESYPEEGQEGTFDGYNNGGGTLQEQQGRHFGGPQIPPSTGISGMSIPPPRHQLNHQNQQHPTSGSGFLPPLRTPEAGQLPPEVLALILKTQGADQILNSFGGNNGVAAAVEQISNLYQQQQHQNPNFQNRQQQHRQQQPEMDPSTAMTPLMSTWGGLDDQNGRDNNGGGRSGSDFSSLGTSSWGPPPGAQPSGINLGNTSTSRSQEMSSPRSQPEAHNLTGRTWQPSPTAAEFIPKSREPAVNTEALAMAIAQLNFPEQPQQQYEYQVGYENYNNQQQQYFQHKGDGDTGGASDFLAEENEEFVLQTVTDCINALCAAPAEFNRCVRGTVDVVMNHLNSLDTLSIIVTLLLEQGISTPNFRYSGARLCQAFQQAGVRVGTSTFKVALLKRCEEEFRNCIGELNRTEDTDKRAQGLLMFLGELYVNFQNLTNGEKKPVAVIGLAAVELMTFLVQKEREKYENIKTVVQVLKLLGWNFEHSENVDVQQGMETLLKDLSYISAMTSDSRSKSIIDNLIELKKSDWGHLDETASVEPNSDLSQSPPPNNAYGKFKATPVLYELPDSEDDEDIDERYLVLDDEPEDVARFYEEFLAETESKKNKK